MIEIEGKTIRISRGDSGTIKLTIPLSDTENYEFQVGDKVQFRVFEKKNYNNVFLDKEINIEEITSVIDICLTEKDTSIGEIINKPVTYWYEISLNEIQTVVGYDDEGPAELILYPAHVHVKDGE